MVVPFPQSPPFACFACFVVGLSLLFSPPSPVFQQGSNGTTTPLLDRDCTAASDMRVAW